MRDPSEQWREYGRRDPYYGVLSHDEFRQENLTPAAVERFYDTGREHVDALFAPHGDWRPGRALDFGCGVGRLVVPLAARCDAVVGVDVSPDALEKARAACAERGIENASFAESLPAGGFDLVHTTIVMQHIPPADGYGLFRAMAASLNPGGRGIVQITVGARPATRLFYLALRSSLVASAWNLARRRPRDYPTMQMNAYRLEKLLTILHEEGIADTAVAFLPAAGPTALDSAILRFQRPG